MTDLHGRRVSKPTAAWYVAMDRVSVREWLLENHGHPISYSYMLPSLLSKISAPLGTQVGKKLEPGYRSESPSHTWVSET